MGDGTNPQLDRRTFLQTTGAAGAATALGGVASAAGDGDGTREILVGVSATASAADVEQRLPANATVVRRNEALGYMVVELPEASAYGEMSAEAQVNNVSGVRYTEDNATYYPHGTPDDDLFDQQYAPQQVRAPTAWDTTEGSSDVTIAIVDQGVMYDHPDLQSRFGTNKGKDFVDGDDDPYPESMSDEYHGTHVAGIASATTNNGTGVAGMSDSTLLSCRALGTSGGSTADIADAVQWATDQGADVINMSLGGGGYSDTMKNAVSYALNNGALVLASAGNDGTEGVSYPAGYNETVAVSAVDENEQLASFSQYGDKVDVTGPGVDVLSCWTEDVSEFGGKYNQISGTSMSCPAATGVAALGKAANPDLTADQLRQHLKDTAVDIGLSSKKQGAGRVDAANIVGGGGGGGNESPTASFTTSPDSPTAGESVSFDGSGSSDSDGSIAAYEWDFGDGATATGQTASHTYDSSGDYTATLTVTDGDGASDSASQTISVGSGGGGGTCGDSTASATETGSLSGTGDQATYTYSAQLSDPCGATVSLSGPSDADFDLYLTFDGRTPTTSDYDRRSWNYGSEESIDVSDSNIDSSTEFGLMVDSYSGSGSFTLSIDETGTGSGGGGGNEGPTASFTASPDSPTAGESVSFDGSGSSDSDGSIAAYEWDFGDGATATGQTAAHTYDAGGDYTVTLTVTDDDGATDSASQTLSVGSGGGTCGATSETASATGSLSGYWDDDAYSYSTQTADPCQATFSLSGPTYADFDLYLTTDGRTPTTSDYDYSSTTLDSEEQIVVELAGATEFGILVDSWDGDGDYTISVEELGK